MPMKAKNKNITRSSGNVFADLDLLNPEELQLKARLTHLITRIIRQRGWTQSQAAKALGIKLMFQNLLEAKVSSITPSSG
jgi:predicted XRE-type DNA-binding protein